MNFKEILAKYQPNQIKGSISRSIAAATGLESEQIYEELAVPPQENWGDYGWPCFAVAKTSAQKPAVAAAELANRVAPGCLVESVKPVGPYLNFTLKKDELIRHICGKILSQGDDYGKAQIGHGRTIVIDFSSPNVAKPMGIGHLRSTVIGAALKRIYEHLGFTVIGINHLGDWGTQFGKLVAAYQRWGDPQQLEHDPMKELYRLYVKIHQEAANDPSLEDTSREIFKRLEQGDPEVTALWRRFVELSKADFQRLYDLLGIKFDSVLGESFYNDQVESIVSLLRQKGLTRISQDALIVPLEEYGLEPLLLRKSDGTSLYATRDLAAAVYRYEKYQFDGMLYVVGVAQALHFKQLFKVLELAGFDWARRLYHISFGWVTVGGEMMSTRRGNVVFLEEVIRETIAKAKAIIEANNPELPDKEDVARMVGVGAVIFADLSVRRETDVAFEWERMLDFDGQTAPYLQYAHARLCSVLRKHGQPPDPNADYRLLVFPEEVGLAKKLLAYPEQIVLAARLDEPYVISSYLLDLVGLFSTYFQKYKSATDKILSADPEVRKSRANLAYCVKTVIKSGLGLLGIEAPEQM